MRYVFECCLKIGSQQKYITFYYCAPFDMSAYVTHIDQTEFQSVAYLVYWLRGKTSDVTATHHSRDINFSYIWQNFIIEDKCTFHINNVLKFYEIFFF